MQEMKLQEMNENMKIDYIIVQSAIVAIVESGYRGAMVNLLDLILLHNTYADS